MKAIKRIKLKILHICIHFLKGMKQDVELNQKFNLKNIKMVKNYRKNYVSVVTLFFVNNPYNTDIELPWYQ